ncbi:hypothetical protein [Pseudomonas atacamensis]|uniref:hypothetical protein n=1 Tax=Pseudomonas atacamensis TaxID=2565368 RepID=UPI0038021F32
MQAASFKLQAASFKLQENALVERLGRFFVGGYRVVLGVYPFFAVLRLAVSPLRRLTFLQAPKKVSKKR